MRKLLIATLILNLLPLTAFATAQQPDVLLYDGKKYSLLANPLESYYNEERAKPRFFTRPGSVSTGNWRGYVATWKIEEDFLYLVNIDSWICESLGSEKCKKADLKELFGEKYQDEKVKADWFTGELRVPDGELLQYVHMGYGSIYEREIILKVEAGKITGKKVIDNTKEKIPSRPELERQELEKMKPKEKGKN